MNTIEGNKIIAEFLEWEMIDEEGRIAVPNLYPFTVTTKDKRSTGWTSCFADELEFHTSWDWLMPIIEKIESDFNPAIKTWVSINGRECGMWNYFDVTEILREGQKAEDYERFKVQANGKTKIEATYSAVLQFIQWYTTHSPLNPHP